jgi:hypothetical protein
MYPSTKATASLTEVRMRTIVGAVIPCSLVDA